MTNRTDTEHLRAYVGDAVYVALDDYAGIVLTTEDGIRSTNRIVMEPEVWASLIRWKESADRWIEEIRQKQHAAMEADDAD